MKTNFIGFCVPFLLTLFLFASLSHANYVLYNKKKELNEPPAFTGTKTYYDQQTNKMTASYQYSNGEKNGPYREWDARTGELTEEGTFLHDQFNGVRKTYRNGKLQMELVYDKGISSGVQKDYRDGVLARVYLMLKTSDMPDTELYFNKKGQLTSLQCGAGQIGAKDAEWCGRNGKLNTVTLYDDEGRVSETVQYLWGLQSGVDRKFNVRTGKLMREEHYEKGHLLRDGERHFDKEGNLLSKTDCDNTKKNCTETDYFEDGNQIKQIKSWVDGRVTRETAYYQNGKPSYERLAKGDHFLITEFYDSGKTESRGTYKAAIDWSWNPFLPDGIIESFDENGKLSSRETYVNGQLQGQSDFFWEAKDHEVHEASRYNNDKLVSRKFFVDGKPVSESQYMPDGSIKSRKEFGKSPNPELEI